jgi:tetratricopeptide (TPR) repeat protein
MAISERFAAISLVNGFGATGLVGSFACAEPIIGAALYGIQREVQNCNLASDRWLRMLAGVKLLLFGGFGVWLGISPCEAAPDLNHTANTGSGEVFDMNAVSEFEKIEAADEAAQADVDKWVRENNDPKAKGNAVPAAELQRRIAARFEPINRAYEDFVRNHPADARARLGYGNFLNDRENETGAQVQWEKALELDPGNPAIYHNLANRYCEVGPADKAFEYFEKAIQLRPTDAVYYHNFGDSLYVLRKRASLHYGITEQQVFGKVLLLYSNALRFDPQNFDYARDLAQTYYSLKPLPFETALGAWTNALNVARKEIDREDACVHLARVKMLAGRFEEARSQLNGVTNENALKAKTTLLHNISEREREKR